jgi:lipid-A-disaccharide synthase
MDVFVVAGEASGDQHAADVVAALKRRRGDLRFFGMGGPKLAAQGVELIHGAHEISVMGIAEVLPRVPRIWRVLNELVAAVEARRPAVALLVDVPDFNLRVARHLKRLGVPVAWYVAPMVWAWREGRTKVIARRVDELFCILPFEEAFLRERGVPATYVGNPVVDQLPPAGPPEPFRRALGLAEDRPVLALLPGSRASELRRLGATLREIGRRAREARPAVQLVVPVAPGLPRAAVEAAFSGVDVTFIDGRATEVLGACDVAVVASGTATLEAGLMRRPLVAVYRVSPVSYWVGRALVRIPYFCLVNLLVGRRVVPELLQGQLTVNAVLAALEPLWSGPGRDECLAGLDELRAKLGQPGAAARVADGVLRLASPR